MQSRAHPDAIASKEVRMKKILLAGVAALAIAGSTIAYAQHREWSREHARLSPEDRAAFADARIAAVHAGLKLTPDQEKLWPPVETAVRDFAKMRIDRANARMNAQQGDAKDQQKQDDQKIDDPVARLRNRADRMAATAAAMKKIADAADPLYKTLDDGQKRRLALLTHKEHRFGGGEGWRHRGLERGMDGDRDRGDDRGRGDDHGRGFDRDGGPGRDHGGRGGPERL
jgi:LTXXQ motif family protein